MTESEIEKIIESKIKSTNVLPDSYVAYIKDDIIRKDSTSGGFFTALAEEIIKRNGIVYGVAVGDENQIIHTSVTSSDDLYIFRGSKYVQSFHVKTYVDVKANLESGKWVLYTGTPCQVEGLKSFLGKDYDMLVTLDVFCHGVGSPRYWKKYTEFMEKKYDSSIKKVKFREKTYGYNSACMALYFKNGRSTHKGHDDDLYWSAFSKFLIFRPSCYNCKFKTINHVADFSIGDFWNSSNCDEKFQKADGCSLVLVHTYIGKNILSDIRDSIETERIDLKKALLINGGPMPSKLITSSPNNKNRDLLFQDLEKQSLDKLMKKYMPLSLEQKLKQYLKPILYRLSLLEKIKRLGLIIKSRNR